LLIVNFSLPVSEILHFLDCAFLLGLIGRYFLYDIRILDYPRTDKVY